MSLFSQDKRQIFRQSALDRLASADQLDSLVSVTDAKGWIALISLVVLIAAALVWSFFGSIPTRVKGKGVLLASGSVVNVASQSTGSIAKLYVRPDRIVRKGDLIATIAQPELAKEIEDSRERTAELEAQNRQALSFAEKNKRLQKEVFAKKTENLNGTIRILNERKKWLQEKLAGQTKVLERGLITKQALIETQQGIQQVDSELQEALNQQKQLAAQEMETNNRFEQEAMSRQLQISESRRAAESVAKKREQMVSVLAPCDGRVLEVMAGEGSLVHMSMPVISIERLDGEKQGLEAVIYVSMADGKQINPGMTAQITPGSVKREEYGFIFGKVKAVSRFPSTTEGMMSVLANDKLVGTLTVEGAPIAIRAALETDPASSSGYRWSSGKGPNIQVTSGTLCDVYVTVREQPPISMIIPFMKKSLGLL